MSESKHPAGHVLQAYRDDELEADLAAQIAAHCERCEICRAELSALERLGGLLAAAPAPELPRTVWPRVRPGRARESRLRPAFAIAACAVGIMLGALLGPVRFGAQTADSELAWTETVTLWNDGTSSSLLGIYQSGQD